MPNRGDTLCLCLKYKIEGEDLVEGAYEELEFQINSAKSQKAIKKLLSKGEIVWGSVIEEKTGELFTGYLVNLSQSETFTLVAGPSQVQLRVKKDGQVGSSKESQFELGSVLSDKVI